MSKKSGSRILLWLKRIGLGLVCLIVLAVLLGSGFEAYARHQAKANFPPPGRLVDIGGGRRMHIDCRGQGLPVVVLEAGLDTAGSLSWSAVQDKLAGVTRVCAYDRAGISWSPDKPGVHDADGVAADLHATLRAAGEQGPYVLVGHSLGGPYIMDYTRHWPGEVAGLVFVDASHPDQLQRFKAIGVKDAASVPLAFKLISALEWTGVARLLPSEAQPNETAHAAAASKVLGATSIPAALAEQQSLATSFKEAGQLRTLGDRPIVVLTAMKPFPAETRKALGMTEAQAAQMQQVWKSLQDDEASWSTRSRHQLVPDSTHYIQFGRPDIVIEAVKEVVGEVRGDRAKAAPAGRAGG